MDFLEEDAFNTAFQARLRETRTTMKWSHPQMAHALGLGTDAYKKIELRPRSAFPLYLFPRLIFVTGRPYSYWMGGKSVASPQLRTIK